MAKIDYNLAKKVIRLSCNGYKEKYPKLFKNNKYRIYISLKDILNKASLPTEVEERVEYFIGKKDYEIIDYIEGTARKHNDKNIYKIGRILQKNNAPELLAEFRDDLQRNVNNLTLVISKHPYDIACASHKRGWTSCLNIKNGDYRKELYSTLRRNTGLICYLISKNDLNIKKPLGRVFIHPYYNSDTGQHWLHPAKNPYGIFPESIKRFLTKWLNENYNDKNILFICDKIKYYFKFTEDNYNDDETDSIVITNKNTFKNSKMIRTTIYKKDLNQLISNIKEYDIDKLTIEINAFIDYHQYINDNKLQDYILSLTFLSYYINQVDDIEYEYDYLIFLVQNKLTLEKRNTRIEKYLVESKECSMLEIYKYITILSNKLNKIEWKVGLQKVEKLYATSVRKQNKYYNKIKEKIK